MQDILGLIDRLTRPRLLIRAARLGAADYDRDRHLPRLLGYGQVPRAADALMRLLQDEAVVNSQRKSGDASYSLTRHLDLLIAMMGEARILRASQESRARQAGKPA
ncbi:DUF6477 family protein [Aestuariivita boseongensis]|uniref:DUF6477 family protein n=1 Tax=Aestuariivita boseongensis TaxID=1470562 RepID=UPI0006808358|nr:DUF6477 family protein [Aestuariivita boseongensis]